MSDLSSTFAFNKTNYVNVIRALRDAKYRFLSFDDLLGSLPGKEKLCLLRHDVDVSMDYAVEMAFIEREHGAMATYFVMLRSPMYNLLSRHGSEALSRLIALGHRIGLHFDASCQPSPGKTMQEELAMEMELLGELVGSSIPAFSFHQPTEEVIRLQLVHPDSINTYNQAQLPDFKYISDSNRVWRELNPFDLIDSDMERVQILMHPIWWMCEDSEVLNCWEAAIGKNFDAMQHQLLRTERAYGPRRSIKIFR